jgi:N-acetylmuramoyl-L-alanine amidase
MLLLAALLLLLAPAVPQDKKLTVYWTAGSASFLVVDRNGAEYVVLTDILDQFGSTKTKQSDDKLRLRFSPRSGSTVEAEFNQNSTGAKVGGRKIELSSRFLISADHGLVPTSSLPQLMSSFLGLPVNSHQTARRLFVGAVSNTFTYDLQKAGTPRVVLHFLAPVSPSIASEPGRLRMTFAKDPVVANAPAAALADSTFSSLSYSESNGAAEIAIAATSPLLASFSDGGKTITITAQQNAPAISSTQNQPTAASPNLTNLPVPVPTPPRFLVVIDAAHGGADPGAAITPTLSEKDVVLAFARRLKSALENQGVATVLLRDSDSTLTFDQRTVGVNSSHAALVISVHATSSSSVLHVYTALLTPVPRTAFVAWDTAQAAFLDQSQAAGDAISKELSARKINNSFLPASLRPLNSFARPAVAIELAPAEGKADSLILLSYQQPIVSAVTAGIVDMRSTLESSR